MSFFFGIFYLLSLNSLPFNPLVSVPRIEVYHPHSKTRILHKDRCFILWAEAAILLVVEGKSPRSSFQMQCQVYYKQNNCSVCRTYFITILVINAIVNEYVPCHKFILFSRRKDRFASFPRNYNNGKYTFVFRFP